MCIFIDWKRRNHLLNSCQRRKKNAWQCDERKRANARAYEIHAMMKEQNICALRQSVVRHSCFLLAGRWPIEDSQYRIDFYTWRRSTMSTLNETNNEKKTKMKLKNKSREQVAIWSFCFVFSFIFISMEKIQSKRANKISI